ncbi:hypothetical protein FIBSPDRAFT_1047836 [Athelia psychrophila]|uniref:RNA-dependent RNA polymerase n=1 Tax=Athelia psychrophila TaxID=1759441 RepID=A0A166EM03_9AGAM|nr:hypothetical protein FIBSPDRAFT_1047836 [Fibularhizoctonia sp. CBS 109695]
MPAPCFVDHSQDIEAESQARAARNETQLQYCAQGSRLALKLETITNLAENDVPRAVISTLFHEDLKAQVATFTQWDGLDAMPDLWRHHAHVGGVRTAHATRESAAEAKAMGCRLRRPEEADDEDDIVDSDLTHGRSTAWWDEANGLPSPLEETCMVLLDFGPLPANSAVLQEKVLQVALKTVEAYTSMFKIDVHVPRCLFLIRTIVFEDENQVKSSRRNVWVIRNPYKHLADTRKVKAVYKPQLANYTDVIVCSVKGHRRLADWLAGGDYDGDKGSIFLRSYSSGTVRDANEIFSHESEDVTTQKARTGAHVMELVESEHPITSTSVAERTHKSGQ